MPVLDASVNLEVLSELQYYKKLEADIINESTVYIVIPSELWRPDQEILPEDEPLAQFWKIFVGSCLYGQGCPDGDCIAYGSTYNPIV